MEDEVCGLGHQLVGLGHGGDDGLDRLLAQFLRDLWPALGEQAGGVGGGGILSAPGADRGFETVERIHRLRVAERNGPVNPVRRI